MIELSGTSITIQNAMANHFTLSASSFTFSVLLCAVLKALAAQQSPPQVAPPLQARVATLVQEVTDTQAKFFTSGGTGLKYRFHWTNRDQAAAAEVIGSADGRMSRVMEQDGAPIRADSNEKEEKRLLGLLKPGKLQEANKTAMRLQPYFLGLIRAMPQAMLYTLAPGQPQRLDVNRPQIVLDYAPNPAFHAKSLAESSLSKLSGRLWIDSEDHHLLRMAIHVDRDVNVAGGLVAKVFAGGTVDYDQRLIAEGQYAWTHIRMHLRVREFLVKTVPIDTELTANEIQLLSPIPSGPDAIRSLLTMQVGAR